MTKFLVLALLAAAAAPATALFSAGAQTAATEQITISEQAVTFSVENMTCALCPATVKRAMERVDGVRSVEIDYAARTATVVFDAAVTSAAAIAAASTNAGYPAVVSG